MAVIPSPPSFVANDYSLAKLTALSNSVGFTCRVPVVFSLYKTGDQSITAATATAITWNIKADSDNGFGAAGTTKYFANTQGYFHVTASVPGTTTGTDAHWTVFFQATTGSNNPLGAGVVTPFGIKRDDTGTGTAEETLATSAISPYMYNQDYLEVWVVSAQATTITHNWLSTANNDFNGFPDGGAYWTGRLLAIGP